MSIESFFRLPEVREAECMLIVGRTNRNDMKTYIRCLERKIAVLLVSVSMLRSKVWSIVKS